MTIRIILADDHKLFREGMRALLAKERDMEAVAEAGDGRATMQLADKLSPDVVVMDVSMPDANGIEATRKIAASHPKARVLAVSMHADRRFVADMLRAGAAGYVLKDCASEELVRAIRTIAARQTYLCAAVAGMVAEGFVRSASEEVVAAHDLLTPREREVLQLIAEGKTTKEIAYTLAVSGKTVETFRQKIMEKLGLRSVAELTKFAVREGLTSLDS